LELQRAGLIDRATDDFRPLSFSDWLGRARR